MKWGQAFIKDIPQLEGIISDCGNYRIGRFNEGSDYGAWYRNDLIGYWLGNDSGAALAKSACSEHRDLLPLRPTDTRDG